MRLAVIIVGAISLVLPIACKGPILAGYRNVTIDQGQWKIRLTGEIEQPIVNGRAVPVSGPYYTFFTYGSGGRETDHVEYRVAGSPPNRYSHMEFDHDYRLGRVVFARAILKGDFGTVYATKECFFNTESALGTWLNHFSVESYDNNYWHDPGKSSDVEPLHGPSRLSHVSVVRILEKPDQTLVVSAVYSREGKLRSVYVNASKNGNWVHSNYISGEDSRRQLGAMPSSLLKRYGLPDFLDLAHIHAGSANPLFLPELPRKRDVVNLHFNFNEWVQQHDFYGSAHEIRYLTFEVTQESRALEPPCNAVLEEQLARHEDPAF